MSKTKGITQLPDADRMEGIALHPGPTPQTTHVSIQYRNSHTGWCEVKMPLLDALYLLNQLEALSADHGYDPLRRPPGT